MVDIGQTWRYNGWYWQILTIQWLILAKLDDKMVDIGKTSRYNHWYWQNLTMQWLAKMGYHTSIVERVATEKLPQFLLGPMCIFFSVFFFSECLARAFTLFVWSFQLWQFRVVSGYRRNMGYSRVGCRAGVFAHLALFLVPTLWGTLPCPYPVGGSALFPTLLWDR